MAPWVEAVLSQRRTHFMTAAAARLLKVGRSWRSWFEPGLRPVYVPQCTQSRAPSAVYLRAWSDGSYKPDTPPIRIPLRLDVMRGSLGLT